MMRGAAFKVLACFYNNDSNSFVKLCEEAGYPSDLGGYYIRQLIIGGYIEKEARGRYKILPKGRQQLALRYGKPLAATYPRLAVIIIPRHYDGFAVLRRTVQPFLGSAEWPAGTVHNGEAVSDAVRRLLENRLGVAAPAKMVGFFRRIDLYENDIFDDKLFAVHTADITSTRVSQAAPTGIIELHAKSDLGQIEKPGRSLLDIFKYAQAANPGLREKVYILDPADFSAGI